jgi:cation/acetate symporter
LKNPGLVSIPLAFIVGIVVSLATSERAAEERFDEVEHRIHTGEVL